jgi:hypothetical protein
VEASPWLARGQTSGDKNRSSPELAAAFCLTLEALPGPARARLVAALEEVVNATAEKLSPFALDLDDDDAAQEVTSALREQFWPQLNTAFGLVRNEYGLPDGSVVRALASRRGSGCEAWTNGTGAKERQLRFVAWPVASAVLLRSPDDESFARLTRDLGAEVSRQQAKIGGFVTAARQSRLGAVPERAALLALSARARKLGRRAARGGGWLRDLAQTDLEQADALLVARFIRLGRGECLVAPRLAAVARHDDLARTRRKLDATIGHAGRGGTRGQSPSRLIRGTAFHTWGCP